MVKKQNNKRTKSEYSAKTDDSNKNSLSKNDKITISISVLSLIISTGISIFVILDNYHSEQSKKYNIETEIMIQTANNDFLSVENIYDYRIIFEKYKEIQKRKPKDNIGCEKFLDKVEIMLLKGHCDDNTKLLLNYAKELNVVKNNVRLINFEKICNNQ